MIHSMEHPITMRIPERVHQNRTSSRQPRQAPVLRRGKRAPGTAGYTLLEVMFSVAILGFGMLGLYALHHVGMTASRTASRITVCRVLADQQMEYLQGLPWGPTDALPADLTITNSDLTSSSNPYAFFALPTGTAGTKPAAITAIGTTSTSDGPRSYYRTWDVSYPFPGDTSILQIKIRVIYYETNNNRPHGVTISSFRYQDPA